MSHTNYATAGITSLPSLLAVASGRPCSGPHRCVFCAAPASEPYTLPDSFTTRDTLRCPGSGYICSGCVLALEEVGTATYHDGERYEWTKAYRRMCSHVITADPRRVVMATKAHGDYLRGVCLSPPDPPFAVSLAVSGQKHVLYRGVVCWSRSDAAVTLEGERVDYRPDELADRLALCGRLCAATGKPALDETPGVSLWIRVCERYGAAAGESMCEEWDRVRQEPISRLASFLTPRKDVCDHEYPGCPGDRHDGVPPPGGGSDRPEPQADRRGRSRERQGGSQATLPGFV